MQVLLDKIAQLKDGESLLIGSDPNVDVVIRQPDVSPRHAEVLNRQQRLLVRDLDSEGGTFIDQTEVRGQVQLRPGDVLRFGKLAVAIPLAAGGPIANTESPHRIEGKLTVAKVSKVVNAKGGKRTILDGVSFQVKSGQFVGVLGGSGSGKSTLMKSIAGNMRITEGVILLDGIPIESQAKSACSSIAYLPQDVVIHESLISTRALDYIAQLKKLGDSGTDRQRIVLDALGRVGMADRAAVPIQSLSGGQRKRVALAAELLGDPQLILLDEATSGLDPATEAEMMTLFRSLADEGRTVLCITHFPGRLHLCDRLVYLMQGRCIFDGTPDELKAFFAVDNIEDAYGRQADRSPEEWEQKYRESAIKPSLSGSPNITTPSFSVTKPRMSMDALIEQTQVLTSRYWRLQLADAKNLFLLFAQPPIIALMIAATFGSIKASFAELHAADTKQVAFVLVLAVLWCSGTISVREIVKELPILRHELRFGLGLPAYLASKVALLGTFALAQTTILLLMVRYFTDLTGPAIGQLVVMGATALAGVALGLLVSTIAGSSERAMTILPVLLIGQAIFSGGLARLTGLVESVSMAIVPAYWALDGLKAQFSSELANATYPGAPGHFQPPILGHGGPVGVDILVLILQATAVLVFTYLAARRLVTRSQA